MSTLLCYSCCHFVLLISFTVSFTVSFHPFIHFLVSIMRCKYLTLIPSGHSAFSFCYQNCPFYGCLGSFTFVNPLIFPFTHYLPRIEFAKRSLSFFRLTLKIYELKFHFVSFFCLFSEWAEVKKLTSWGAEGSREFFFVIFNFLEACWLVHGKDLNLGFKTSIIKFDEANSGKLNKVLWLDGSKHFTEDCSGRFLWKLKCLRLMKFNWLCMESRWLLSSIWCAKSHLLPLCPLFYSILYKQIP